MTRPRGLLKSLVVALLLGASTPGIAATPAQPPREPLRVLFVGNSLVYTNNLPGLLRAFAKGQPQGPDIVTATYVAPGGTVAERWQDGHVADALRTGDWDAIVLQERGGLLACLDDREQRQQPVCRRSERAHQQFVELAQAHDTRAWLLATWGPDDTWQRKLDRAMDRLSSRLSSPGKPVSIIPAGSMLRAFAREHSEAATFPDDVHPSMQASLVMAAQLYGALTGHDPQAADVVIDFALLPVNALVKPETPMEQQPQLSDDGKKMVIKAAVIAPLLQAAKP